MLLEHFRAHALTRIRLGTTERFLAAHRFYPTHGFEPVPRAELPSAFPVMAVDPRFHRLALEGGAGRATGSQPS